jgi:phage-related protein
MRAISPNRQTGVAPHVLSRSQELHAAGSPPKSTHGSLSPLQFGQDLVKVLRTNPGEPATFALAGRTLITENNRIRPVTDSNTRVRRRWRDYRTAAGGRPVKKFIDGLTDEEVAAIVAGMKEIATRGLAAARHLRGDIYEVRADASTRSFRLLFSAEGRWNQILLSLSAFEKRTQKAPPDEIELAEKRLADWRRRGAAMRKAKARPTRR